MMLGAEEAAFQWWSSAAAAPCSAARCPRRRLGNCDSKLIDTEDAERFESYCLPLTETEAQRRTQKRTQSC